MLTYILITVISFCVFQIILQLRKMNDIGNQYYEAKLKREEEK
ncbi:hypothetical protein [Aquimarina algiphila]|nr:hypothetical protein [Aquimarina algiphila]